MKLVLSVSILFFISSALSDSLYRPQYDIMEFLQEREGEFLIDTIVFLQPEVYDAVAPAIALGDSCYLLMYTDTRGGWTSSSMICTPLSEAGIILDSSRIQVSQNGDYCYGPHVAYGNGLFMGVWRTRILNTYFVYGSRIMSDGTVIDTMNIFISSDANFGSDPCITYGGEYFFVTWGSPTGVHAVRIDSSGTILDQPPILISPNLGSDPFSSFDGTNYLVVWCYSNDIWGKRVNTSGIVIDTANIAICAAAGTQSQPVVTFGGTSFLVAWCDARNDYWCDIYAARVTPTGTVLDTSGIPISTASGYQVNISVDFDGTNYMVIWRDDRLGDPNIYASRVATSGIVLDPNGIPICTSAGDQQGPSIAFGSNNYLAIWQDTDSHPMYNDLSGAIIGQDGTVIDTIVPISRLPSVNSQIQQSVAFDGQNYLGVWVDQKNGNEYISGIRVDSSGVSLDSQDIVISNASSDEDNPSVAFNGTNYLVAWQRKEIEDCGIYGARITPGGINLDPNGFSIQYVTYWVGRLVCPAVASDGLNYLVVWIRNYIYLQRSLRDINCSRISPTGSVLDYIPISTGMFYHENPAVTFNGTKYLIVWQDNRNNDYWDIYGALMNPSGGFGRITISTAVNSQQSPAVTTNGSDFFVVWMDKRNTTSADIYGCRINSNGQVMDPSGIPIAVGSNNKSEPATTFDGTNYIVVWQEYLPDSTHDLYGAKVSTTGNVLSTFPVCTQNNQQLYPALARGNNDQILTTWTGWTDSVNLHPANTFRIWGTFYPYYYVQEKPITKDYWWSMLNIYPNPFSDILTICLAPNHGTNSQLRIYDICGRLLKIIPSDSSPISWNGDDESGHRLPAGVYFIHFETPEQDVIKKIIKLK